MKSIMKRAWEIAKEAVKKFGGKVRQYFAEALRMAWSEAKKAVKPIAERIEEMEKMGFNRWQKNGMDRLYINAKALGLDCTYYKTGNISSATFNGERISNSEAGRIKAAKTYIDLKTNMIVSDSARLSAAVAEMLGIEYSYGYRQIAIA